MSVKDGRIVLPDGMSHRVLILPDNQPMAQEALRKVADLIEAGAIVIGPAPTGLAGSPLQPDDEEKFEALVKWSWGGNRSSEAAVQRRIGAGYLVSGQSTRQVLVDAGVPPDFEHSGLTDNGSIYWIHRKTEDADIYFVTSHWQPAEKLECISVSSAGSRNCGTPSPAHCALPRRFVRKATAR